MCRVGSVCLGALSSGVADAVAAFKEGKLHAFSLSRLALLTGDATCLLGGHLRAALAGALMGYSATPATSRRPRAGSPWSNFAFGRVHIKQGSLQSWIALSGRLAPAAARPLVVSSREDWVQVHCASRDLLMEVDVHPARRENHLHRSIEDIWRDQLRGQRSSVEALNRQLDAMRRSLGSSVGPIASSFMRRAEGALSLPTERGAIVTRLGRGGGSRLNNSASAARSGTCPAAVFASHCSRSQFEGDYAPLGWVLVEPATPLGVGSDFGASANG